MTFQVIIFKIKHLSRGFIILHAGHLIVISEEFANQISQYTPTNAERVTQSSFLDRCSAVGCKRSFNLANLIRNHQAAHTGNYMHSNFRFSIHDFFKFDKTEYDTTNKVSYMSYIT